MIKKLTLVLFGALATLASAQEYTYTFTAPVGAISCSTRTFGTYPVSDGACPLMPGFRPPDNLYNVLLEMGGPTGNVGFRLDINPVSGGAGEVVIGNNVQWTGPSTFPPAGVPVQFTMNANITQVCPPPSEECMAASGDLTLAGQWSWQYQVVHAFRSTYTVQNWTNTSPVVINGQSTVAILDWLKRGPKGFELALLRPKCEKYEQSWAQISEVDRALPNHTLVSICR